MNLSEAEQTFADQKFTVGGPNDRPIRTLETDATVSGSIQDAKQLFKTIPGTTTPIRVTTPTMVVLVFSLLSDSRELDDGEASP